MCEDTVIYNDINANRILCCEILCGDNQAEIEAGLNHLNFRQIKALMQLCQCSIENLTESICRAKGIKYVKQIKARDGVRAEIIASIQKERTYVNADKFIIKALIMLSESVDDYIEHRITADKTIEEILKDIQGSIAEKAQPN